MLRVASVAWGIPRRLMAYTALARKYRPKQFRDLIAQPHVAGGLAGAVVKQRVAHGYLLTGPRGVGKTSAARILAMALNCARRSDASGEPCGECESCRRIWAGAADLDVVEIDAASNRGVDDARELRERAMYASSGPDRFKVYIIDEAHMLTREAWNALLKILEEPPPRVVFVFATTDPQRIANTAAPVLSRLQRFDFRRIGPGAIAARLREVAQREGIALAEDAAVMLAAAARGALRDALSMLDQVVAFGEGPVTAERVRDALGLISDELYAELLEIVARRHVGAVFPFVAKVVEAGADLPELLRGVGELLRHLLAVRVGGEPEGLTESQRALLTRWAPEFREGDVLRMLRMLAETEEEFPRTQNPRLKVELLFLEWTLLDRVVELADVLAQLGQAGPPPPAPRARPPTTPDHGAGRPLLERARAAWPQILDAVGRERRMVREALAAAELLAGEPEGLVLQVRDPVHFEGLERSRQLLAEVASEILGQRVTFALRLGDDAGTGAQTQSRRLDRDADRRERLRHYRSQDPALDAMADALDLELLE